MRYFAVALGIFLPLWVSAAGFASQPIFLSKSPVTEGDTVKIYTIVSNSTGVKFTGEVVIKEDDVKIGATPVSLAAGATQTTSVSWKPDAGNHAVIAQLQATDGSVAEEKSATFTINEKPKPPAPPKVQDTSAFQSAAVESSQGIQDQIGSFSPQTASFLAPAFKWIDGARLKMSDTLNGQLLNAGQHVKGGGAVEGLQTENPGWSGGVLGILWTLYFYLLTILTYLISHAGVFYPVAAIAFLYLLWKLFRRIRRPS